MFHKGDSSIKQVASQPGMHFKDEDRSVEAVVQEKPFKSSSSRTSSPLSIGRRSPSPGSIGRRSVSPGSSTARSITLPQDRESIRRQSATRNHHPSGSRPNSAEGYGHNELGLRDDDDEGEWEGEAHIQRSLASKDAEKNTVLSSAGSPVGPEDSKRLILSARSQSAGSQDGERPMHNKHLVNVDNVDHSEPLIGSIRDEDHEEHLDISFARRARSSSIIHDESPLGVPDFHADSEVHMDSPNAPSQRTSRVSTRSGIAVPGINGHFQDATISPQPQSVNAAHREMPKNATVNRPYSAHSDQSGGSFEDQELMSSIRHLQAQANTKVLAGKASKTQIDKPKIKMNQVQPVNRFYDDHYELPEPEATSMSSFESRKSNSRAGTQRTQSDRQATQDLANATAIQKSLWKQSMHLAVIAMFGTCLGIVEQELFFQDYVGLHNYASLMRNGLKALISIDSFILVAMLIRYYSKLHSLENLRRADVLSNFSFSSLVLPRHLAVPLAVECCLFGVHVPPYLDITYSMRLRGIEAPYRLESFVLAVMVSRFLLVTRALRDRILQSHESAQFLSKLSGIKIGTAFAIKILLHKNPLKFVAGCMLLLILLSAYIVRIFEFPSRENGISLYQTMWIIMLSITTVGYGDDFPLTHMGRAGLVGCVLLGVVLVSLVIAVIEQQLALTNVEYRMIKLLAQERWNIYLKKAAAKCIVLWWRQKRATRKLTAMGLEIPKSLHESYVKASLDIWKEVRTQHRAAMDSSDHIGRAVEDISSGLRESGLDAEQICRRANSQGGVITKLEVQVKQVSTDVREATKHLKSILKGVAQWELQKSRNEASSIGKANSPVALSGSPVARPGLGSSLMRSGSNMGIAGAAGSSSPAHASPSPNGSTVVSPTRRRPTFRYAAAAASMASVSSNFKRAPSNL